jgi:hypothetical protein
MPLYTYVVAFKGKTYAAQSSHSNFRGFVTSWADLPQGVFQNEFQPIHQALAKCPLNLNVLSYIPARSQSTQK